MIYCTLCNKEEADNHQLVDEQELVEHEKVFDDAWEVGLIDVEEYEREVTESRKSDLFFTF